MDTIQARIDFLKSAIKLLIGIINFAEEYFPVAAESHYGVGLNSKWEFYNAHQ